MNMADPRKILILGHNGFIGSHLSSYLDRHASMEVVGRSLPSVDLTRQENCQQLSAHFDKDTVLIILAAVKRQFGDSLSVYMQNMEITRNIADLIEANPVQRVIYFSSAAVYGEETENLDISEETSEPDVFLWDRKIQLGMCATEDLPGIRGQPGLSEAAAHLRAG